MAKLQTKQEHSQWRLSVAPMLDWTDRHCRRFHRLITKTARLYTEMVTTGALIHGDVERHLGMDAREHPVALQLGGSDPAHLAHCARLGAERGYDEINLNCGCPSDRVQSGAFGACLMAEPARVADCIKAMVDVVDVPVTVKHRTGIDRVESYGFMRDFVGEVSAAGCRVFIVHARNAWLQGLSPKENREIPPLRYQQVYRLKRDFPGLTIVINGGIQGDAEIGAHLEHVDGVMLGRAAYHNPWVMRSWDHDHSGDPRPVVPGLEGFPKREDVEAQMVDYMELEAVHSAIPWHSVARHMLGLYHGEPNGRSWRRVWSDHRLKMLPVRHVAAMARAARLGT